MSAFTACYFCGAAVDAPIAEYDVVPRDVESNPGPTISLCPTCKVKLEKAFEPALTRYDGSEDPIVVELDPVGAPASHPEDEREPSERPEPDRHEDPRGQSGDADGEGEEVKESQTTDDEPADSRGATPSGMDVGATETADTDRSEDGISLQSSQSQDDEGSGEDGAEAPADETADPTDEGATPVAAARDPDAPTTAEDADEAASEADTPERPAAETYNRIVRLLQNREFPVNRSEFETLASSAYEVSPAECEQVIDYAIYRGELVENRGMLEKPDSE